LQKTRNEGVFAGGRVTTDRGRRRQRNAREEEGSAELGFLRNLRILNLGFFSQNQNWD